MARKNVIVIGAGIAGLTAGRLLTEAGENVTVLESRDRVGGRIHSMRRDGKTLELGAQFLHGLPPDLWHLIHEVNLQTEELEGKQICYEQDELTDCGSGWEQDFDLLERMKDRQGPDCSFAEYLDQHNVQGARREHLVSYIEGFNAADHRLISVAALAKQQAAEDAIEGDRAFRVCDGYSRVPEFLVEKIRSAGGEVSLDSHVQRIAWKPGQVEVTCLTHSEVRRWTADCAVITLPLGVLQKGSVEFSPTPKKILHAASLLRMGHVRRIDLLFRERFWANWKARTPHLQLDDLSFLFAFPEIPSTWWTQFPSRNGCLTAWVGGPRADTLTDIQGDALRKAVCRVLARLFHVEPEKMESLLIEFHSHDWQRDPLSLGAYSYVTVGGIDASQQMSEPVENTLYFAGEHTDTTGHWGTVHAALRSGVRAAEQILKR